LARNRVSRHFSWRATKLGDKNVFLAKRGTNGGTGCRLRLLMASLLRESVGVGGAGQQAARGLRSNLGAFRLVPLLCA
jgi:hypothetical protein